MANIVLLGPDSWATNYKIAVSVASNNLTVALKTAAGTDATASNPIMVRIGDAERLITSALSVTKNAGTNWCNAGSSELATKEVDYFVYLGYNATDGVVIGFSRIPYATLYSDFSTTTTNEKYAGISTITSAAAGDNYVNIGRFAATLSAGAGYTWTVPTFTSANLVQRSVYETRFLTYVPTLTGYSANPTQTFYEYQVRKNIVEVRLIELANGTSNNTAHTYTAPFTSKNLTSMVWASSIPTVINNSILEASGITIVNYNSNIINVHRSAIGTWTASGGSRIVATNALVYEIA